MNADISYATLCSRIRAITPATFEKTALAVFRYQYENNALYQQFVNLLNISPQAVQRLSNIPCLPISLFKYHTIQTETWTPVRVFTSSGTTGQTPSRHLVRDLDWYSEGAFGSFEALYGPLKQYVVLALLPSYLERQGSSLVFMAKQFVDRSKHSDSGFFLYNTDALLEVIRRCEQRGQRVLLVGVTYALLDLAEAHAQPLKHTIIMETGGMKGRREEETKAIVHQRLKQAFKLDHVHSEYGMTELLSQAYSKGQGVFESSAAMRVLIREATDPLSYLPIGRSGGINVIDLANLATCSFIATDDLGRAVDPLHFEVLGRLDASELRGCNLMLEDVR